MEIVYFLLVAIALYFGAGWILDGIESYLGKRLAQRQIAYFAILLVLAVVTFSIIQRYAPA